MSDKIIFTCVGGFVAGVFLRSYIDFGLALPTFLIFIACVTMVWSKAVPGHFSAVNFFLATVFFLSVAFGVARFEISVHEADPDLLARVGSEIVLRGWVAQEPDGREDKVFLEVDLKEIVLGESVISVSDRARISVDFAPEVFYGDYLRLSGKLSVPENFETDSGQIFDYESYLAKEGIHFEMYRPAVEILSRDGGNPLKRVLFGLKKKFLAEIAGIIEEPEHSLLAGLLLGVKHGLGDSLTDDFRRAGLVHIIVLSGFNMTIVAFAIRWFLEHLRLSRVKASFGGIIGIALFVIMVGSSATAVRASIMAILGIVAVLAGRDYRINRALFLAGFMMIMHNPQIAAFDPSFQLSFMATLGLVHLSPIISSKLSFVPVEFGMREIISATIATQVFVLPLLILMSGEVSLVSVLANVIVLPLIPITMFAGFIAGVLAFISDIIAAPVAFIAILLLKFEILIAHFFGSLSFATISVPQTLVTAVLCLYVFFLVWFFIWRKTSPDLTETKIHEKIASGAL